MARRTPRAARPARFAKRLVVLAKAPVLGRVKRRLGREIGGVAALRFYRTCLAHVVGRLARDPRWQTLIAVTPDREAVAPRTWHAGAMRVPQGRGDLGHRMQRLFREVPRGPVIIVGGDIPALRAGMIQAAFGRLGGADAVFGRAPDGGYWLIGLKRVPKVLRPFGSVRWSSPQALADTLKNLAGSRVAYAHTLNDVDTEVDWRRERANAERLILGDNMPRASTFNSNLKSFG
jgi:uncharacterized protein